MSKPIDELVVQIKADTRQLQKELNQIQRKLKTTGAVGGVAATPAVPLEILLILYLVV